MRDTQHLNAIMATSGDQIRKDIVLPIGPTTNPTTGSLQIGLTIANRLTGLTTANPTTGTMIVNPQRDLTTATGKMRHRETATAIRKVHPENVAPGWASALLLREGVRELLSKVIEAGEVPLSIETIRAPWALAAKS